MTTIAYKDGVIAYDSRVSEGRTIVDDDFDKRHTEDQAHFFLAGNCGDKREFVEAWFSSTKREHYKTVSVRALVWDGKQLWTASISDGDFHRCEESTSKTVAIGSGGDHALTAMDMGATAEEAVKMAIKRDSGSGGKVRTFRLPL